MLDGDAEAEVGGEEGRVGLQLLSSEDEAAGHSQEQGTHNLKDCPVLSFLQLYIVDQLLACRALTLTKLVQP